MSYAAAFINGRLTADPELRQTNSGTSVASLRVAVNSTYKDKQGEKVEDVSYFNVTVWGKQAEVCNQYLKKGDEATIRGDLNQNRWEKDGQSRSTVEIVAQQVDFGQKSRRPGADAQPAELSNDDKVQLDEINA